MVANILIATAILWVTTAVVVIPLTNISLTQRMAADGLDIKKPDALPPDQQKRWASIATGYHITWDILVLAIAGFYKRPPRHLVYWVNLGS